MSSPPLAYHDLAFLESNDARPIRILAEYLDPLRRFRAHNIQDTVVFFGSARVNSRLAAQRALARVKLAVQPHHEVAAGGREHHRPSALVARVVHALDQSGLLEAGHQPGDGRGIDLELSCELRRRRAAAGQRHLPEQLELSARDAGLGRHPA